MATSLSLVKELFCAAQKHYLLWLPELDTLWLSLLWTVHPLAFIGPPLLCVKGRALGARLAFSLYLGYCMGKMGFQLLAYPGLLSWWIGHGLGHLSGFFTPCVPHGSGQGRRLT